jgi:hypothetical protein
MATPTSDRGIERVVMQDGQTLIVTSPASAFATWTVLVPFIPGYVHIGALRELVEAIFHGLRQLEQNVSLGNPDDAIPQKRDPDWSASFVRRTVRPRAGRCDCAQQ